MIVRTTKAYVGEQTLGLTSQAAVEAIGNRYDLVLVASKRVREIRDGAVTRVESQHGPVLTALKEIEQGKIDRNHLFVNTDVENRRREWK
jgi:DNA-directed RNA polymerase subunit omega